MLFVILLYFLGLLLFGLVAGPSVALDADDVAQWPYAPGLLVKWVSFLGSLHWPVEILGLVVFLMSSCSFFLNFGLGRGLFLKKQSSAWASNFSVGCSFWSRH